MTFLVRSNIRTFMMKKKHISFKTCSDFFLLCTTSRSDKMNTFRASKKVYRTKQKKMYWGRVIFLCLKDNPDIADTYSWCTTFVHKITTCMCVWLLKCVKGIAINRYECSYNAFTNFARFNFFLKN